MRLFHKSCLAAAMAFAVALSVGVASAQSGGSSTAISGTVLDSSGAVVANATVEIRNVVSGFDRTTTTDSQGKFSFPNVPFNPYHMTVTATGFAQSAQDVDVRSALGANVKVSLTVAGSSDAVTVEARADLVENDPTGHTDVAKDLFDKIPPGKWVVVGNFAGYAGFSGSGRGFEWHVSRDGRSCVELVLGGWPADYRSAEQNFLQPDSSGFDRFAGSDSRRAARGIWRQDEPGDCRDHALRAGRHHAARQRECFLWIVWIVRMWASIWLMEGRSGATSFC